MKAILRARAYLERVRRSYLYQEVYGRPMKDTVRACEAIVGSKTASDREIDRDLAAMEARLRARSAADESAFVSGVRMIVMEGVN